MATNDSLLDLDRSTTSLSEDTEDFSKLPQTLDPFPETIPPQTYHIQHDGWHKGVRIWALGSVGPSTGNIEESSLVSDSKDDLFNDAESQVTLTRGMSYKASGSSEDQEKEGKKKYPIIDPSRIPASYYIKRSKTSKYVLFQGPGPDDECAWAKRLIMIDGEGLLSRDSKYTHVEGDALARMYAPDPVVSWGTFDRTLEDSNGVTYRLHTKDQIIRFDIVITRISDGVEVAYFDRAVTSVSVLGTLEVKVPLSPESLHLILAA
ncbi:hypothetical protein FRC01_006064, partial [Tulasnella sp. 417]